MTEPHDGARGRTQGPFDIAGERITLPVRIRRARSLLAVFAVPMRRSQQLIDYSGLEVLPVAPGRTACALVFVDYLDGDLHAYREFGVGFLVRSQAGGGPAGALGDVRTVLSGGAGMFIHRLPVTEEFSCRAGCGIWGFPKVLSTIEIMGFAGGGAEETGPAIIGPGHGAGRHPAARRGVVRVPRADGGTTSTPGELVADLRVARGLPLRMPGRGSALAVFTRLDGITRKIAWTMAAEGVRARLGGASLLLGRHPWADELRSLGLPRRALTTVSIDHLRMRFDAPEVVSAAAPGSPATA